MFSPCLSWYLSRANAGHHIGQMPWLMAVDQHAVSVDKSIPMPSCQHGLARKDRIVSSVGKFIIQILLQGIRWPWVVLSCLIQKYFFFCFVHILTYPTLVSSWIIYQHICHTTISLTVLKVSTLFKEMVVWHIVADGYNYGNCFSKFYTRKKKSI